MTHFHLHEFDSPDLPGSGERMDPAFLAMLDQARGLAGVPFVINSGYRTRQHNRAVGGKGNSSHLMGYAADIDCRDSRSRSQILTALISAGFHRIGIASTFIHVDNDPGKVPRVIWTY